MNGSRPVIKKREIIEYTQREFYFCDLTSYTHDKYYQEHYHQSIELTYVVKGRKIQRMNNQVIDATAGTLLLVNSGDYHEIEVESGLIGIVVLIDRKAFEYYYPECINKGFNLDKNKESRNKIISYLLEAVHASKIQSDICILKIMELLVEYHLDENALSRQIHDPHHEMIHTIIEYIDFNYMNPITLEDIARLTHYNASYISTYFKNKKGISLFTYIKNIRLQHCLHDLKETEMTMKEIAKKNGFKNVHLFHKAFKESYNMTPMEYRKQGDR